MSWSRGKFPEDQATWRKRLDPHGTPREVTRRAHLGLWLIVLLAAALPAQAVMTNSTPLNTDEGSDYACQTLLRDSARMLLALLDPWTGLPYDQIPCGSRNAEGALGVNPAWGVVPQLAYAAVDPFAQDPAQREETVHSSFTDQGPGSEPPTLLYALKIELHLSARGSGNEFGGVTWGASVDLSRYRKMRIRYSTSTPGLVWELKLNSGKSTPFIEPAVQLRGSEQGAWREEEFDIATAFTGTDVRYVNYIVLASNSKYEVLDPVLWVDQIAFEADPEQMGSCGVGCPPNYPDLACYEPLTGAVNIANALTVLSLLPEVPQLGLLTPEVAEDKVKAILDTMESFPVSADLRSWFQDWHSPASGMPDPRNRIASLTDQPQLLAALMVVEQTWPRLASQAAALERKMDFSVLVVPPDNCCMHWAVDRCTGVQSGCLEYLGTDTLLGSFLGVASEAPLCTWARLAKRGCALDGSGSARWYTTAGPEECLQASIPAVGNGGPFLQLAGLQYLKSSLIPVGARELAVSAGNMLRAQASYSAERGLSLAGWANASDPDACAYLTCGQFAPQKVSPYIWAMGLDVLPDTARSILLSFHNAGADRPLETGTLSHEFGLRDSWDQATGSGRDAYLYLDTGWTVLGLLNACHGGLVRERFGAHPVAERGYELLQGHAPLCSCVGDCNGDGEVTINSLITLVNIALGNADVSTCPNGVASGTQVDIALIIQAVNDALNGCGG